MNKSLVTNLLALTCILAGLMIPASNVQSIVLDVGLFALSGSITNWLAIHMLFERVPFLYGSGVIPNRFESFKAQLKELVMQQFFTEDNVSEVMAHIKIPADKWEEFAGYLDYNKIFVALAEAIVQTPMGKMLGVLGEQKFLEPMRAPVINKLKQVISDILNDSVIQQHFLEVIAWQHDHGEFYSTIEGIVDNRLNKLTPKMVKEIVQDMIQEHLGWLVVWGGVFGGVIGLTKGLLLNFGVL